MLKKIVCTLILTMVFVSSCSSNKITYTPPVLAEDWSVKMTQSGGIAGIMRVITVSSDGKYTVIDERNNQTVTKELTAEQLNNLQMLISNFEFIAPQSPSGCADCFEYDLEIESAGKKMIVNADDISLPDSGLGELVMFLQELINSGLQ